MKILVDADACPVKGIIVEIAKTYAIEVIMVADTSHILNDGYSTTVTVDKGADSVDIRLINLAVKEDVVVTQDYGVAAMALGKGCKVINQNGIIYSAANIDELLFARHIGKKIRRAGGKTNSVPKRTREDDNKFREVFLSIVKDHR